MPSERTDAGRAASTVESPRGLSVADVRVSFSADAPPALDGVSVTVRTGRVTAILGPSGCGKSTLLRAVAGLQPISSGRIQFDGQDLAGVPTHRRDFALMFQDGQLFGQLNVEHNVAYGLRRRRVDKRETARRVSELLELVGMEGFEKRSPATLSGGQQQRVALARALAVRPRLLLLDEPLSALDRAMRERLAADVAQVLRAEQTTAMFVTHDHTEALTIADDMALMRAGKVVDAGEAQRVWQAPADVESAQFLGYRNVIPPALAAALGLRAHTFALRPDALLATVSGAGLVGMSRVAGQVLHIVMTPTGPLARVQIPATDTYPTTEVDCTVADGQTLKAGDAVSVRVERLAGVEFATVGRS